VTLLFTSEQLNSLPLNLKLITQLLPFSNLAAHLLYLPASKLSVNLFHREKSMKIHENSYRCLCVVYVFLDAANLTAVFPCFFPQL